MLFDDGLHLVRYTKQHEKRLNVGKRRDTSKETFRN